MPIDPVTGLMIVSAGVNAGKAIYDLFQEPDTSAYDIPEAMKREQKRSEYFAGQLSSGQGLSDKIYSRGIQSAKEATAQSMAATFEQTRQAPMVGALTLERIAQAAVKQTQGAIADKQSQLEALDAQQEIENLKLGLAEGKQSASLSDRMRQMEIEKQQAYNATRQAQFNAFTQSMGNVAQAAMMYTMMNQPDTSVVNTTSEDAGLTNYSGGQIVEGKDLAGTIKTQTMNKLADYKSSNQEQFELRLPQAAQDSNEPALVLPTKEEAAELRKKYGNNAAKSKPAEFGKVITPEEQIMIDENEEARRRYTASLGGSNNYDYTQKLLSSLGLD